MSEQSVFMQMEDWGYFLLPKPHPDSPSYTGLLVAIREAPTKAHFDPEMMQLRILDRSGTAPWITLRVKPPFREPRCVCPGKVILCDRINRRVDFFVFGGSLEAVSRPGETVYSLRSPAPILEMTGKLESIPDQLASETEAMMSELLAQWEPEESAFDRRLAHVNPSEFYLASLRSILVRYEQNPRLRVTFHDFYVWLRYEKEWLAKESQWYDASPSLEDLLAPG